MAARSFAAAPFDAHAIRTSREESLRLALAGARPSPEEVLSLWPIERRKHLVLWARFGPGGELSMGARLREHALYEGLGAVAQGLRRIRHDVPVVLELDADDVVVIPLRALGGA